MLKNLENFLANISTYQGDGCWTGVIIFSVFLYIDITGGLLLKGNINVIPVWRHLTLYFYT